MMSLKSVIGRLNLRRNQTFSEKINVSSYVCVCMQASPCSRSTGVNRQIVKYSLCINNLLSPLVSGKYIYIHLVMGKSAKADINFVYKSDYFTYFTH